MRAFARACVRVHEAEVLTINHRLPVLYWDLFS